MIKLNILIVDDEQECLDSLMIALKPLEHNLSAVTDPVKALGMIRRNKYELIITDLRMPKMHGIEFIAEIRKIYADISIIVISAFYNMEITLYKITSFVDMVFVKPVNIKELINTIKIYEISYENKVKTNYLIHNENK